MCYFLWCILRRTEDKNTDMIIHGKEFSFGKRTYLMGILNVTPDSFSDGGYFNQKDAALKHTQEMIKAGVDILDIGGESTRPGYKRITAQEEMERVLPIIYAIRENFDIPISIDTYKSEVALAAAEAGADLLNDIWGFRLEVCQSKEAEKKEQESLKLDKVSSMALAAAKTGLPVCLMHNRRNACYQDFSKEIMEDLQESLEIAKKAGVDSEKIILDPGIGFGKTYENNLWILKHLERFQQFGLPILLGVSRKSVIGLTLDLPVTEREEGTIATSVLAVMKGCAFLRVHNVEANKRAIKMIEKILSIE